MSEALKHVFITTHAVPSMTIAEWKNHCGELEGIIAALPEMDWRHLNAYGPNNGHFGPGSFCLETKLTPADFARLAENVSQSSDMLKVTVRVDVAEH